MRLLATLLAAVLLVGVLAAGGLLLYAGTGDVVETQDETALGADITDAHRTQTKSVTGLTVPASAVWHAYAWHTSLDQTLTALVSMPAADAEAWLADPPLDAALWRDAASVPALDAALAEWPAWPTLGATVPGRRMTLDLAPGRTLAVTVGVPDSTTRTLRLSWQTY